jgi:hypothetical protein
VKKECGPEEFFSGGNCQKLNIVDQPDDGKHFFGLTTFDRKPLET